MDNSVSFGGESYEVKPLSIRKLRILLPVFDDFFQAMAKSDFDGAFDAAEKIIPEITGISAEDIADKGTDLEELWDVVKAGAAATGLKKLGERLVAEAEAARS